MIIGLMHVKDEHDIIEETLRYYHSQGVSFIVVDDSSTDGTYEICDSLKNEGVILELHQTSIQGSGLGFRNKRLNTLQNPFLTAKLSRDNLMIGEAFKHCRKYSPKWVLVSDADAFLETRNGDKISDALKTMESKGFNTIEFFKLNFFPTEIDPDAHSIKKRILHYVAIPSAPLDWSRHCGSFEPDMYIGKHHIGYKSTQLNISPQTWIYRHYPFRSYEHAKKKLLTSHDYQYGSRAPEWVALTASEKHFLEVSPLMENRIEGQSWKLRHDIFQTDELRSTKEHNAHKYLRKIWPTFPK